MPLPSITTVISAHRNRGYRLAPGPRDHLIWGALPALRADPLAKLLDCAQRYGDIVRLRFGPFIGHLYDRFGPRPLIVPGAVIVSLALWGFYLLLGEGTPWGLVLGLHVFLSVGLALMFTPLFTSSMAALNQIGRAHV